MKQYTSTLIGFTYPLIRNPTQPPSFLFFWLDRCYSCLNLILRFWSSGRNCFPPRLKIVCINVRHVKSCLINSFQLFRQNMPSFVIFVFMVLEKFLFNLPRTFPNFSFRATARPNSLMANSIKTTFLFKLPLDREVISASTLEIIFAWNWPLIGPLSFSGSDKADKYHVKVAHSLDEACKLLEVGFEYVTDMDGAKIFRKRK